MRRGDCQESDLKVIRSLFFFSFFFFGASSVNRRVQFASMEFEILLQLETWDFFQKKTGVVI